MDSYIDTSLNKLNLKSGLWATLKNRPNALIEPMEEGQFIKIGSQICFVKSIKTESTILKELENQHRIETGQDCSFKESSYSMGQGESSDDFYHCRICTNGPSRINPFIANFCKCKSSSIHLNCLKEWMARKSFVNEYKNMKYYNHLNLECEICKTKLKSSIKIDDIIVDLVSFAQVKCHTVLSLLIYNPATETESGNLVIYFKNDENHKIKIGRTQNNDVIFPTFGVSKEHALIVKKGDKLYLVDLNSNFKCHRKVNDVLKLEDCKNTDFVISGFKVDMHLSQTERLCSCSKPIGLNDKINSIDPVKLMSYGERSRMGVPGILNETTEVNGLHNHKQNSSFHKNGICSQIQMIYSKKEIEKFHPRSTQEYHPKSQTLISIKEGATHECLDSRFIKKKDVIKDTSIEEFVQFDFEESEKVDHRQVMVNLNLENEKLNSTVSLLDSK